MLQIGPTVVSAGQKLVHHQARIDLLQLEQSRLAAELAAGEEWDRDGFNSAYDWIRVNCHLPGNVAVGSAGGAAVRPALEPLARKSGDHGDRVLDQRYADALVELASGGKPANLQVTASIETLKGLAGAAGAEMEFSLPISSAAVQRMACDCSVTRVVLSQESVTIDVGRSKRVI